MAGTTPLTPEFVSNVMKNAGEKLLSLDLAGMQLIELICIRDAFQFLNDKEYDINDEDISRIFDLVTRLIEIKKMIHGNEVQMVNERGHDAADLTAIQEGEKVDDDAF